MKCPGRLCKDRLSARIGNKACTNGLMCKQCCDDHQREGFLPKCGYSSHNYERKVENVSPPAAPRTRTTHEKQRQASEAASNETRNFEGSDTETPRTQVHPGALRGGEDSFFSPNSTQISSISPYHALGGSKFSAPDGTRLTPKDRNAPFKLAWYTKVGGYFRRVFRDDRTSYRTPRNPRSWHCLRRMGDSTYSRTSL